MNNNFESTVEEVEDLLLAAHKACMATTDNSQTVIHFLMHELFYFFLTHLSRKRLIAEHGDKGNRILDRDGVLRFGFRGERRLSLNLSDEMSIKHRILFQFFSVVDIVTFGKLPRVYLGKVSFRFLDLVILIIRKKRLPFLLSTGSLGFDTSPKAKDILFEVCGCLITLVNLSVEEKSEFILDLEDRWAEFTGLNHEATPFNLGSRNQDIVLSGSPGKLSNRALAFRGTALGYTVIGCLHGSESGAADHLSWTFDDYTNCDVLLGYGESAESTIDKCRKDFFGIWYKKINYIPSTCEVVQNLLLQDSEKENVSHVLFKNARVLYVSARTRGMSIINGVDYLSPIKYVEAVTKILQKHQNIDFKQHPKGNVIDLGIDDSRYVQGSLQDVVTGYDCVMMDFAGSTAFSTMAASDVPILFVDMGFSLEGLCDDGKSAVIDRVQVIDFKASNCNFEIDSDFIIHSNFNYRFVEKFCLGGEANISRLDALARRI